MARRFLTLAERAAMGIWLLAVAVMLLLALGLS